MGARSLLDRWRAAHGLYNERRETEGQGRQVGRSHSREPEGERILRSRYRPSLYGRHATRQLGRLVAAHGGVEDIAAALYGHGRSARHRLHDPIFPLSGRDAALHTARPLDVLGHGARRRQSADRILALQHYGRRRVAPSGRLSTASRPTGRPVSLPTTTCTVRTRCIA